ncbi:MAG: DUF447 family protein [Candidatus Heimdallarchaeota archaeon]|nr:DUF447 family protein [Candidatus Heimdallarchaeota archaeon]MBY8992988.1 DUF447 family protein [Candidatus Heimdallarchaeota archaeon]
MMNKDLPFQTGIIYEAIVTTYNQQNQPNAAPMGFAIDKEKQVIIRPYKESDTYKNLQEQKECIINITSDPDLFVKSTLFQDLLIDEFYIKSAMINAPILKACEGNHIALKAVKITKEEERGIFYCEIIDANLSEEQVQPHTRAFSSLIEILIHSTRVIHFSRSKELNDSKVMHLRELIEHHSQIISRVTQKNSQYQKYVEKILIKISQKIEK